MQIEYQVDISGKIMRKDENVALAIAGPNFQFSVYILAQEKEQLLQLIDKVEQEKTLSRRSKKKKKQLNSGERGKRIYAILLYHLLSN